MGNKGNILRGWGDEWWETKEIYWESEEISNGEQGKYTQEVRRWVMGNKVNIIREWEDEWWETRDIYSGKWGDEWWETRGIYPRSEEMRAKTMVGNLW